MILSDEANRGSVQSNKRAREQEVWISIWCRLKWDEGSSRMSRERLAHEALASMWWRNQSSSISRAQSR